MTNGKTARAMPTASMPDMVVEGQIESIPLLGKVGTDSPWT